MAKLQVLAPDTPKERIAEVLAEDGAAIVEALIPSTQVAQLSQDLLPHIQRSPLGDDFSGRQTQRTGALVARVPSTRKVVTHPQILAAAETFLAPYTDRIILHLTQTIYINPEQGKQPLHRDRLAWGGYIPRSLEPQFNTIWALTDFTKDNGATRLVPGSNHWPDEQRAEPEQICQAEMAAGSVLLYSGSVIHGGGENRTDASRLGLNITYCLGWLRQEENQYLSCPPEIAKDLDPQLQELLGYTSGNYALGYYSDPSSTESGADILPPEMALGRRPRKGLGYSLSEVTGEDFLGTDVPTQL